MSKNKVKIGNDNSLKNTNFAGGDINVTSSETKNSFWRCVLKHIDAIITAIISGAVSAFIAWLVTYLCLK